MKKTCITCGKKKDISAFYFMGVSTKTGTAYYKSSCLECVRAISRQWYYDNKERRRAYDETHRKEHRAYNKKYREGLFQPK